MRFSWRHYYEPLEKEESREAPSLVVTGRSNTLPASMVYSPVHLHWKEARTYRNAFLLPYLDLEIHKMNPAVLLGLLHNRTHYPPQDWAPYDSRRLILSWVVGF